LKSGFRIPIRIKIRLEIRIKIRISDFKPDFGFNYGSKSGFQIEIWISDSNPGPVPDGAGLGQLVSVPLAADLYMPQETLYIPEDPVFSTGGRPEYF
jgi:hypothetical protein